MALEDIVTEIVDQIKSKDPGTLHVLHDMICEEMDKYPQIDTTDLRMDVALEVISNFNLLF